ncbi:Ig-like domain-containing protein [Geomesophilobacter sediminis]|uniref:Ig-like domain-containing protein n=1 Tax=Geomesophilobacter sediminis TaxID=2798584 RepID=A0A8J7IZ75_9BACT|nr:Ig-like domain-containing protein [Geomesophilobacter sediminis]MBJ6723328.1 Ig-like domain-containing protein [Geomesophilobacter sediminis]
MHLEVFMGDKIFRSLVALAVAIFMTSCGAGSGGGDNGDPNSPRPQIQAVILSFDNRSNKGNIPNVSVVVKDGATGVDVTEAVVTVNDMIFGYNSAPGHGAFEGNISISPGDPVVLKVKIGKTTYSASSTQFTSYPILSAPDAWHNVLPTPVSWTQGDSGADSWYNLAILDAQDPYGVIVWPKSDGTYLYLDKGTTTYRISSGSPSVGNRLLFAALVRYVGIYGASSDSKMFVAGGSTKPITVVDAALKSLSVTPTNLMVPWGAKQQFQATGVFADDSVADVTNQVKWDTSFYRQENTDNGLLTVEGNGGQETISVSANQVLGSTAVTVLAPRLRSIVISPDSRTVVPNTVQHFTANGYYENNRWKDITNSVTWSSSNTQVATVGNDSGNIGQATFLSTGNTAISATLEGVTQSAALAVVPLPTFSGSYAYLQSDTGDNIGQGGTYTFTEQNARFRYDSDTGNGILSFSIDGSQDSVSANFSSDNILNKFTLGQSPNVAVTMSSRGCEFASRWYYLDSIRYTNNSYISSVDLHFVQHCYYDTSPALYGWIHLER